MIKQERGPIETLRARLLAGETTPRETAAAALARSNRNANRNVYLAQDPQFSVREAERAAQRFAGTREKPALFGLPISLKDCFDLEGFRTTAGTRFYAERSPEARRDSAVAARLREQGAVITGKTHLHPLAYGITGENRDFGDCVQPENSALLTGGSTSGGAASVQEGSAVAAIGTDTGGSIRVPAALCGLAGFRASIGLAWDRKLWAGGVHLAQTFDTLGWVFRDLRDAPLLAEGLFGLRVPSATQRKPRIGVVQEEFLHDCEQDVRRALDDCKELLAADGAELSTFAASGWNEAMKIYAPIQASEAAAIHAAATGGDYSRFPSPIDERLAWGASLSKEEVARQRARHDAFRAAVDDLLERHDFLLLPCSPMRQLRAGADHSETRARILRYTVPMSLAGTPVVTLPYAGGAGMQLVAARGHDARLLAYAAELGRRMQ
ncbi:MAG TPA: amidase [Dongiaceae bacterium]|nr:amidase [Dongiaceae bacterium]